MREKAAAGAGQRRPSQAEQAEQAPADRGCQGRPEESAGLRGCQADERSEGPGMRPVLSCQPGSPVWRSVLGGARIACGLCSKGGHHGAADACTPEV